MTRLVIALSLSLLAALAAAWLIALPGTVSIDLGNYRLQPGLGMAVFIVIMVITLAILAWALLRRIIGAPRALVRYAEEKRRQSGIESLSDGMIALQAGEYAKARSLARDARSKLPDNAAAQLLEARSELALGDLSAAREHYRALITNPKTAIAALAGLYEQAQTQGRPHAALTFARKALSLAPTLEWASEAAFSDMAARNAWADALAMSATLPANGRNQKAVKRRRDGILHTALALASETTDPDSALEHANTALKAIADFVPAALIAARVHINRGDTRRASALLRRVWRSTSHPDIATLYAHVKPGSSAVERLKRVRGLIEAPGEDHAAAQVLARAAIEAYEWDLARSTLSAFTTQSPTRQTCLLMAEIEEGQSGDQGKAREWLGRAVNAPLDPAWTADGVTSEEWAPLSPVTGRLDAFEWKVPVTAQTLEAGSGEPSIESVPALSRPSETTAS